MGAPDIAGPARASADDGELTRGGTGFGVRTLIELAQTFEPPKAKKSATKKSATKKAPRKTAVKKAPAAKRR